MTEKRDAELDALLDNLRAESATDFEIRRWRKAIREEGVRLKSPLKKWGIEFVKVASAAGVGFALASTYYHSKSTTLGLTLTAQHENAETLEATTDSATIESIHTKLD